MSDFSWSTGPLCPLAGVTVLDLSRHLPGPWLTRILLDLGATVIKVESPRGDPLRFVHPQANSMGAAFAAVNAGKQSVSIDMRAEEGRALLLELRVEGRARLVHQAAERLVEDGEVGGGE